MQRNEQRTTWHRPALAMSFAVFLVLTFASSPSISSIPTLDDLATTPPARIALPASAPALSTGHEAQRDYLESLPHGQAIVATAKRTGVDGLLIAAVIEMESGFASNAVSPRGAVGLMQVRPSAPGGADLTDPEVNLEAGSRYLGGLLDRYDGDLERALAAYNAGPGVVDRFGGVPPYRETKSYVRRVQTRYLELHQRLWHGDSDREAHTEIVDALAMVR